MTDIINKINALETEKLEQLMIMRSTDDYSNKCYKLGIPFAESEYKDEVTKYQKANKEYNRIDAELTVLYERLKQEQDSHEIDEFNK